jgi:hypothetical protein
MVVLSIMNTHGYPYSHNNGSQQQQQYSEFAPGFNPPTQSQGENFDSYSQFQSQYTTVGATTDDVHYSDHNNSNPNRLISGPLPQQMTPWDREKSKKRRKRHPLPGPAGLTLTSQPHHASFSKSENREGDDDDNNREESCGDACPSASSLKRQKKKKKLKHHAQQYQHFWQVVHYPAWLKMCMALERYVKVESPQSFSSPGSNSLQDWISNEYTLLSQVFADNLLSIPLIAVLLTTTSVSVEDNAAHYYSFVGSTSQGGENLTTCHIMDESSGVVAVGWVSESIFCEDDGKLNNHSAASQRQHGTIVALLKDVPVMVLSRDEHQQQQEAAMAATLSNDVEMDRILLVSQAHVVCKWTENTDESHDGDEDLSNEALHQKHRLDQLCQHRYFQSGDLSPKKNVDAGKVATSPTSFTIVLEDNGNEKALPPNEDSAIIANVADLSGICAEQTRNGAALASSGCPLQSQECCAFAASDRAIQSQEYANDGGALLDQTSSVISTKTTSQQEIIEILLTNATPVSPPAASHPPAITSVASSIGASKLPTGETELDASSALTLERTSQDLSVNMCPASICSTKSDAAQNGAVVSDHMVSEALPTRRNEKQGHPQTATATPGVPLPSHHFDVLQHLDNSSSAHDKENCNPVQSNFSNGGEANEVSLISAAQPKATKEVNHAVSEKENAQTDDNKCTSVGTSITFVLPSLLWAGVEGATQTELPGLGESADDDDERDRTNVIVAQATSTKAVDDKAKANDNEENDKASNKPATGIFSLTSAAQFNEFGIDDLSDDSDEE